MKPQPAARPTGIKTFGQALRKIRTERGLSHKEVADRVGVRKEQVRQWEEDTTFPSNFHLKKLYGTFSTLRFFTTLMPTIEREKLITKANEIVASAQMTGKLEYETFLPPIAGKNEDLPEELVQTRRPKTFGEHLRAIRLTAGIDLEELGELMSVTGQACSAWELDKANPVMDHYVKLRDLFPALKNAPAPDAPDMPKPSGGKGITRNVGNTNGAASKGTSRPYSSPTLRAVPTAFDAIQMPLAEPNQPPEPEEPEEEEEEEIEEAAPAPKLSPLEAAGAEYARYLAAKQKDELRVATLRAELVLAEKSLQEASELAKMAHDSIIEIAKQPQ
jgi:transcriptional regulator with XRE-family HTH domain